MNSNPDKDLYNPEEVQVFGGMCNYNGICATNTLIMLILSCPSLISSIINYIDKLCGDELTRKIQEHLFISYIENVGVTIIEKVIKIKPLKYFEFVFLLVYIIYYRIKILQQKCMPRYCRYDLYICNELLFLCLEFYYYGTDELYDDEKTTFITNINRRPSIRTVIDNFDINYYNDFNKYLLNSYSSRTLSPKSNNLLITTLIQLIRNAAILDNQNILLANINNLFGDIIFYHDLYRYKHFKGSSYNSRVAKIIFVLNEINAPVLGISNVINYNSKIRFPEFINIFVDKQVNNDESVVKVLRYVLVGMWINTLPDGTYNHAEAICRFYNNGAEKYYRISNDEVIECGTQERFEKWNETAPNKYYRSCKDIRLFEKFTSLAVYHAYKWLS